MKKPKITKGPWSAVEYSGYMIIQDEDHYGGLNILDKQHFPLAENNAKACEAVPEMIDALIEIKQTYDEFYGNATDMHLSMGASMEIVNKALKKAGCTE